MNEFDEARERGRIAEQFVKSLPDDVKIIALRVLLTAEQTRQETMQRKVISGQTDDIYITASVNESEKYIFTWRLSQASEVMRLAASYAADPRLSFDWYDAMKICECVRKRFLEGVNE